MADGSLGTKRAVMMNSSMPLVCKRSDWKTRETIFRRFWVKEPSHPEQKNQNTKTFYRYIVGRARRLLEVGVPPIRFGATRRLGVSVRRAQKCRTPTVFAKLLHCMLFLNFRATICADRAPSDKQPLGIFVVVA